VVAITAKGNAGSWRLMERLDMQRRPELDFEHPDLPPHSYLRPHIAYAIARPATVSL
jgi:RimJ/RimL family protein N-acetyltransferase